MTQKRMFSAVTWGNKYRSRAAGNFCSFWRTDEPKYHSHEFPLFDLGEPNPGKVSTSNIWAILFPYLCSVQAWALGIPPFSLQAWVILALHSVMHWHGISGASGRRDFHGMNVGGFFLAFPLSFMAWIIASHPSTKAGSRFQFSFTPYVSSPHSPALPQEVFWPGYGDVSGLCDYSSLLFQQTVTPNNVRFSSVLGYQQPATPIGKNTHRHFLRQDGN